MFNNAPYFVFLEGLFILKDITTTYKIGQTCQSLAKTMF